MKKSKKTVKPVARHRRFSIPMLTIAAIVIAAAAITVVSKQLAGNKVASAQTVQAAQAVTAETGKKYVTVKVAGRDVQVDPQTGQVKPLTPQETKQLADGLKTLLNKSTEGLEKVQHADGSVSMDLQGHFQNVAVIRTNDDGTVEQSCVDTRQQAAAFFGIDPALLGEPSKRAANQPIYKTPPQKVRQ